jgi:nicotinamide phosphoribosyltransferase
MNMSHYQQTALTSCDSYKLGHADQYPPGTTKVYSNFTARSMVHLNVPEPYKPTQIVWFGLQAFLAELVEVWDRTFFHQSKHAVVTEFLEIAEGFCGPRGFNGRRLEELHDLGYLPLEIRALPEGSLVPANVPVLTLTNTLPSAFWLPNFLETWLSAELWKSSTSATLSYVYRQIIDKYATLTGANKAFSMWQGHDFSPRGMSGIADAARSGAGHLLSFAGTDNIPAVKLIRDVYDGKHLFIGGSVPATEHSVMCAGGKETEIDTFRRLIKTYPSGVLAIVSDTWDFWNVITNIAQALKQDIIDRTPDDQGLAKIVFRPDSGDPVRIIAGYTIVTVSSLDDTALLDAEGHPHYDGVVRCDDRYYKIEPNYKIEPIKGHGRDRFNVTEIDAAVAHGAVETLWEGFGGTMNDLGFRTLNQRVGLIYGDSITPARADEILRRLASKKLASDNIVFGIGSYTFQYTTRDSLGFAMKATYVEIEGQPIAIFKDPKTDSGIKKSAKGLLQVVKEDDHLVLREHVSWEEEKQGEMQTVFLNGKITLHESFADIRSRLGVL